MFNGKIEWTFWFIRLCRMTAFEYFVVFNRTAFMVDCLRSWMKHSSSRRLVQAVRNFGCFLCFLHTDFIAPFRIVFPMKCCPTEDVGMYFWLETKMQGKQPPSNSLQSYLFLIKKLSFGETVVHFSFSHFQGGLWIWSLPYSTSNAFIRILKLFKKV